MTTGPMRCLKKQSFVELFSFSQKGFESAPIKAIHQSFSLRQISTDTACGKAKTIDSEERTRDTWRKKKASMKMRKTFKMAF